MDLDEDLCVCFHVSRRKVINYLRIQQPQRVAQLSECHGAGTGCGWCRPFLEQLFRQAQADPDAVDDIDLPSREDYADRRATYRREQGK